MSVESGFIFPTVWLVKAYMVLCILLWISVSSYWELCHKAVCLICVCVYIYIKFYGRKISWRHWPSLSCHCRRRGRFFEVAKQHSSRLLTTVVDYGNLVGRFHSRSVSILTSWIFHIYKVFQVVVVQNILFLKLMHCILTIEKNSKFLRIP